MEPVVKLYNLEDKADCNLIYVYVFLNNNRYPSKCQQVYRKYLAGTLSKNVTQNVYTPTSNSIESLGARITLLTYCVPDTCGK